MKILKQFLPYLLPFIITLMLSIVATDTIQEINAMISDKTWQWLASPSKEQRIIIVDIDEASIKHHGQWPWARKKIATLSKKIAQQGASLQIFDMVFSAEKQNDNEFITQLNAQPTVLAQILAINTQNITQVGKLMTGMTLPTCQKNYPQANAYIANNKNIAQQINTIGHITPTIDNDGIVRKIPAYICYQGKAYPALALTALATAIQQPPNYQRITNQHWLKPKQQLIHPQLPEISIPINEYGEINLPWWLSRESFISISAKDILENKVNNSLLDGAWVIIGSTAFGVGDSVSTPQAGVVSGVEVHTQLLSALLDNKIPYKPQGVNILLLLWGGILSLVIGLLSQIKGRVFIYAIPIATVISIILILLTQAFLLKNQQLWLPSALLIIYIILFSSSLILKNYVQNWLDNQRLYLNLSSYLPEHAAKWIAKQDPVNSMAAHHEDVFVMYVDLRNFSNWCNQLPAEQIGAILHTFYKVVTEIIQKYGGQTEKYVGDAVLCVWRAHHHDILTAANELVYLIEQELGEENYNETLPPLAVGIGIEYGQILVATLGPAQRREYTIIGKTVTTAIQLQEMSTDLALPILIGQNAASQWKEKENLETQGQFLLNNAQQSIEIFTEKK